MNRNTSFMAYGGLDNQLAEATPLLANDKCHNQLIQSKLHLRFHYNSNANLPTSEIYFNQLEFNILSANQNQVFTSFGQFILSFVLTPGIFCHSESGAPLYIHTRRRFCHFSVFLFLALNRLD